MNANNTALFGGKKTSSLTSFVIGIILTVCVVSLMVLLILNIEGVIGVNYINDYTLNQTATSNV